MSKTMSADEPNHYINALKKEVQIAQEEKNYYFNHPVLRVIRGFKSIKNGKYRLDWNDIKISFRHAIRGRKLKKIKVLKKDFERDKKNIFGNSSTFFHPEIFLHELLDDRVSFLIGHGLGGEGLSPSLISPDDCIKCVSLNPKSLVVVNLLDGLEGTEWEGLFGFDRMRLTKIFSDLCEVSEGFQVAIVVYCNDASEYPLLQHFQGSILIKKEK